MCEESHAFGVVYGYVFQFCIFALRKEYSGGGAVVGAHCNDGAGEQTGILPACANNVRLNLFYIVCAYTNVAGAVDKVLCLAIECYSPCGGEFPVCVAYDQSVVCDFVF